MGADEITIWSSGILWVPLILLAIAGAMFGLVRYWQNKTQEDLKKYRSRLRGFHSQRRQLETATRGYSASDPEPYGSRVAALQVQLERTGSIVNDMERQLVSIQERIRRLRRNPWQGILGAPVFWFSLRREVGQLFAEGDALEAEFDSAERSAQALTRVGWEIAERARLVRDIQQQVQKQVEDLRAKHLHGEAMHLAELKEKNCREALAQIPRYFLAGDEEQVLAESDQESVAQAHAILEEIRPTLEKTRTDLVAWHKKHAQATETVAKMRQDLGALEGVFEQTPAEIVLTQARGRFDRLQIISSQLHATLSRMEVESMDAVIQEAARVDAAAREIGEQIQAARKQQGELEQVITELSEGLKSLSAQFASLGASPRHPIQWGSSRHQLTSLSRQSSNIGHAKKPRTPEAIEGDLSSARQLNTQLKDLAAHCQKIGEQHAELLSLLEGPELSQGVQWLAAARSTVHKAREYDPDNWPKGDGAAKLPEEFKFLEQGLQLLVDVDPNQPIAETDLPQRLADTRELAEFYGSVRKRVESVRARLVEIQAQDERANQELEAARAALKQLSHLARSSSFLAEIASAEIDKLQSSADGLSQELAQRGRGVVEKKAKAVSALTANLESSTTAWLDRFNKELETQRQALGSILSELEQIGPLDEPAVAEAQRLLAQGQSFTISGQAIKDKKGVLDVILEIKRRSSYWQSCQASLRALKDVTDPLLESYDVASHNRRVAKEFYTEIEAWMRSTRDWPPTSISLAAEKNELARIDAQWDSLKMKENKAIQLVGQYSSLAAKYQAVGERARQNAERAAEQQLRVSEVESELEELLEQWQGQLQLHRDNPATSEEIRRLLNEIRTEHDKLKKGYRQRMRSYDQILQTLQALHRRARLAQVTLDEDHLIDVNGRMIAFQ